MYVELKNIHKSFGSFKASDQVNLSIEKGKLIALLGPSGSGKTTILRMLAGLEYPDEGDILIDGIRVNDLPPSKRGIGFVFQNYALFRYMTVYDNIAFGLEVQKKKSSQIKERVEELLALIGLEALRNRYPHQLSGGQKQRVAFARALAPNPQLLLLDEPFAAIDAKVRQELRTWLKDMIHQLGITSIFVTHDQEEAVEVADEIIITNQGRVEQVGTPIELYQSPASLFVAQFVGQSVIIDQPNLLKGFDRIPSKHKALIRPEYLRVTKLSEFEPYENSIELGIVETIQYRGSYLELKIKVRYDFVIAHRSLEASQILVGEKVKVLIHRVYHFDDRGAYPMENASIIDPTPVYI